MKKILILALAAMALTVACKKAAPVGDMWVETLEAEVISQTSIIIKGRLSRNMRNSASLDSYGFVWGTDPSDLESHSVSEQHINGDFSVRVDNLRPNTTIWYKAYCRTITMKFNGELKSATTSPYDEVVDLGLSVKWRAWNLGASNPEEIGDYYAWGEIEPYYSSLEPLVWKSDKQKGYDMASYSMSDDHSEITKYYPYGTKGKVDYRSRLITGPEGDDVASLLLGGNWRMPTYKEIDELVSNCTARWETYYSTPGVKFYSNVPGFTDKWIFIPYGGFYIGKQHPDDSTEKAAIWSSTIEPGDPICAHCLVLFDYGRERHAKLRFYGYNIRPVLPDAPPVAVSSVSLDHTYLKLAPGGKGKLTATVSPSNAAELDVFWTSTAGDVAWVDQGGNISTKIPGKATITAGCGGVTATCEVEVTE